MTENGGTFTLTFPKSEALPKRWWERLLHRPTRFRSIPTTTKPLSFNATAAELQEALGFPAQVSKGEDGTFTIGMR